MPNESEQHEPREEPLSSNDQPREVDEQSAEAGEVQPESAEDTAPEFEEADPLTALEAERDELYARLQRVSADYQNSMRRAEQRLTDSIELARGDLLRGFIPVLDHFDRALEAEPVSEDAKSLAQGVRIVRDELLKVLRQSGVERIETKAGDPFDPHLHEAMLRQPAEGIEPNHIAAAFEPGYSYKGRTLRAAKVAVAPDE